MVRRNPAGWRLVAVCLAFIFVSAARTWATTLEFIYCSPELRVIQATQFTHFSVMGVCDPVGWQDLNTAQCSAWLASADVPVGSGYVQGRALPGQTVTFYAVRENGNVAATQNAVTDLYGYATVTFSNLPVTGAYNHNHCAATPSQTWECYEFYAVFAGYTWGGAGQCIISTACSSDHKYMLLEDVFMQTGCGPPPGGVNEHGGWFRQLNMTLIIGAGSLPGPTVITIAQPTCPPPIGIPAGAAILDWRSVTAGGVAISPPATAALDYTSSTIYGYGRCATTIYYWQPSRGSWTPLPWPVDRSFMENQIRWPLEYEGIYALVGFVDVDRDGIEDIMETGPYHTSPYLNDTDGDLLLDGDEALIYNTLPTVRDTDEDLFTDGIEHTQGTNPNDPRDYPGAVDRADHTVGDLLTTMTDKGIFGSIDPDSANGLGLVYPAAGQNNLYVGSLWAGTDTSYVVNHDYSADSQDWEVAAYPDGHVVRDATGMIEQRIRSSYVDSPHPRARYLRVSQETGAWSATTDHDFVLEHLVAANRGTELIHNLYLGQFLDLDIPLSASNSDRGRVDPTRNLVYMWRDGSGPYVGLMLMEPGAAANLTVIHNPTYVWPTARISDPEKWRFLSAADPQHSVHETTELNDWSLLASAGPFDLPVGDSVTIGFALVGGATEAELLAHADRARQKYYAVYPSASAVRDRTMRVSPTFALAVEAIPNPFHPNTTLRFTLGQTERATLQIFDVTGRRVRGLLDSSLVPAGAHEIAWNGCDAAGRELPSGVYLYKLTAGSAQRTGRLVLTR
jgi:hypothetical protein